MAAVPVHYNRGRSVVIDVEIADSIRNIVVIDVEIADSIRNIRSTMKQPRLCVIPAGCH